VLGSVAVGAGDLAAGSTAASHHLPSRGGRAQGQADPPPPAPRGQGPAARIAAAGGGRS